MEPHSFISISIHPQAIKATNHEAKIWFITLWQDPDPSPMKPQAPEIGLVPSQESYLALKKLSTSIRAVQ